MSRKYLKKVLPSSVHVRKLYGKSVFTKWLHDENLWHVNRRSVSLGVAVGLFFCYWPVPFQMVLALIAAVVIRANLPISVILVWISNPLTMVPMYAPAYWLGAKLLGDRVYPISEMTVAALGRNLEALWLGCMIIGTVLAFLGWLVVRTYWHFHIRQSWQQRRRFRLAREQRKPKPGNPARSADENT
jgi:uncharacterized protein